MNTIVYVCMCVFIISVCRQNEIKSFACAKFIYYNLRSVGASTTIQFLYIHNDKQQSLV